MIKTLIKIYLLLQTCGYLASFAAIDGWVDQIVPFLLSEAVA